MIPERIWATARQDVTPFIIIILSQSDPLAKMAKFRNIVVHNYEKIDPAIVVGILRNNLEDFETFKKAIIAYLKTKEQG